MKHGLLPLGLALTSLVGCAGAPSGPSVEALWIVADADTIAIGSALQLAITATDGAGNALEGLRVQWSSSDPTVASINAETGEVVGLASGAVMITGSTRGQSAYREVTVVPPAAHFVDVAGAWVHSCALAVEGRIYCAGWNRLGMLGNGEAVGRADIAGHPALVATASTARFRSVSGFGLHGCALSRSGEVHCWGSGFYGQLGLTRQDFCEPDPAQAVVEPCRIVPARIAGEEHYKAVAAGLQASCALRVDGRAFCWGNNESGALGTSGVWRWGLPLAVDGDLAFATISGGRSHFCATTADFRAFCWGSNYYGQLGTDGVPTCLEQDAGCAAFRPLPVLGGQAFTMVVAGGIHSCGITTARELYCWGNNTFGQLGDGTTLGSLVPQRVDTGHYSAVSVGEFHSCAIAMDGRAYCWGLNDDGELGGVSAATCMDASEPYPCSTTPVEVEGGHRFLRISLGRFHSCGVTDVQQARCWGWNQYGQLGNGTYIGGTPPTRMQVESAGASARVPTAGTPSSSMAPPSAERYAIPRRPALRTAPFAARNR